MTEQPYDYAPEAAELDLEPADQPTVSQLAIDAAAYPVRQHGIWNSVPGGWVCSCSCGRQLDDQLRPVRIERAS